MANWFDSIDNQIFTNVEYRLTQSLAEKFETIYTTTDDENIDNATFPTWYFKRLQGTETANTLENDAYNAIMKNYQIQVISNVKSDCETIANETLTLFKALKFNLIGEPVSVTTNGITTLSMRFRRLFGSEDKITY